MSSGGMPRPVILGLVFLLLAASGLGLLLGLRVATLDESAVIDRAARAHVAGGGRAEDCVARPGVGRIWLVVTCGQGGNATVRAFDRWGFSVRPRAGPDT